MTAMRSESSVLREGLMHISRSQGQSISIAVARDMDYSGNQYDSILDIRIIKRRYHADRSSFIQMQKQRH